MRLFIDEALVQNAILGGTEHLRDVASTGDNVVFAVVGNNQDRMDAVSVLSGGGSGHEPAHSGFVGAGLLRAAVCGNRFASPSAAQTLAAFRRVVGRGGGLVVVKNYTGDRLSFGRAVERWNASLPQDGSVGRVQMIVVADDCAVPRNKSIAGPRGLAGTLLVYKIAAEAAKRGLDLDHVAAIASAVNASIGTVGVAVRDNETVEVGLGIHGEPGFEVRKIDSAQQLAKLLVDMIVEPSAERPTISLPDSVRLVVLINNLGATS
ncbi:hypothetical protein BC830DRAFT_81890, partial [Chytriomyces sp. MP71]